MLVKLTPHPWQCKYIEKRGKCQARLEKSAAEARWARARGEMGGSTDPTASQWPSSLNRNRPVLSSSICAFYASSSSPPHYELTSSASFGIARPFSPLLPSVTGSSDFFATQSSPCP